MRQDARQLIYITRTPDESLRTLFAARGWSLRIVKSVVEADRALVPGSPFGGLLDLTGDFDRHEIVSFEPSLSLANVGWVALTRQGQLDDQSVRRLVRDYCFDYVTVPYIGEKIADAVGHAYGMVALADASYNAQPTANPVPDANGGMIGDCDSMLRLFTSIRKVAATEAPVFIYGESGTGKELTAAAIHERSTRRDQPFVAINCGSIPPHLLQSELFGYERGAFTGANQRKIGRVEAANHGTLFLDEIGDLPLESQASLLRFLQQAKIERLGGHESISVDVRIISATHVDLEVAMRDGRFRADLYHRLCVLRIDEPPLRARGKDIEVLAWHILERFKTDTSRRIRGFAADAVEALYNYAWPGNVRELINRVRRAIVMADGRLITARDLELHEWVRARTVSLAQAREKAERQVIEQALLRNRGRLNEAATELGISRVTLYRLMGTHGMRAQTEERELPNAAGG